MQDQGYLHGQGIPAQSNIDNEIISGKRPYSTIFIEDYPVGMHLSDMPRH